MSEQLKCPQCVSNETLVQIGGLVLACPNCDIMIPPYLQKLLWPERFEVLPED